MNRERKKIRRDKERKLVGIFLFQINISILLIQNIKAKKKKDKEGKFSK